MNTREREVMDARRVFVDMDGVIVDFDAYKIAHGLTGDEVKARVGAYLDMQPIPGALDAVRSLIGMGYEVWLATKPPTGIPHAYSDKAAWVMQHLPELKRRIVITHDKGMLGGPRDFLCDDRPHKANCEKFSGTLLRFIDGYHWPEALRDLRAARDALIAEGSASSEGAERMSDKAIEILRNTRSDILSARVIGGVAAVDDASICHWSNSLIIAEARIEDAVREHSAALEQRISERRPIADEVVAEARSVYSREADKGWEICFACNGDPCNQYCPTCENEGRLWNAESGADPMRAVLEWYASALPRDLPAGSDAAVTALRAFLKVKEKLAGDSYDGIEPAYVRELDEAAGYALVALATAEQPSCGQDARDAARNAIIDMAREVREKFDGIVDAAIAAQQRQGGEK